MEIQPSRCGRIAKTLSVDKLTTRTWSLNAAQLHTLPLMGYKTITVIKDDRGRGIDSIYYGKTLID